MSEEQGTSDRAGQRRGTPPAHTLVQHSSGPVHLAHIYEVLPLLCPGAPREAWSGGEMRIIAFLTDPPFNESPAFDLSDSKPAPDHALRGALDFDPSAPEWPKSEG